MARFRAYFGTKEEADQFARDCTFEGWECVYTIPPGPDENRWTVVYR
jgi:hypothetical protein